ncbi:15606_t:CDS:2 [Racocetra fulgida]|uniref:15606_t:CDS:1 n=1 Tax=Racocetra fulgida TaxID=60492 RepID=A0A9N9BG41_9GLOM|nr:15606_t:CDS:2 [Racocetra fulgida]
MKEKLINNNNEVEKFCCLPQSQYCVPSESASVNACSASLLLCNRINEKAFCTDTAFFCGGVEGNSSITKNSTWGNCSSYDFDSVTNSLLTITPEGLNKSSAALNPFITTNNNSSSNSSVNVSPTSSSNNNSNLPIILSVTGSTAGVVVIGGVVYYYRESDRSENENNTHEKPTLEQKVGKGGFGEVYKGKWESRDVAVKKLNISSDASKKEISDEINILKKLNDSRIIRYYGSYSDDQELLIIMEYAEGGNLKEFIDSIKDLKSLNILLTANREVKIADFGLSKTRDISFSKQENQIVGELFEENSWELKKDTEFFHQLQIAETHNQTLPEEVRFPNYEIYSGTTYHSKLIDAKTIVQQSENIFKAMEYTDISADTIVEVSELPEQLKEFELEEKGETSLQSQIEQPPKQ